jgi:hypothetical protein
MTIKVTRRRNGDLFEVGGRVINGSHQPMSADPTVLATGVIFIGQLVNEFYNQTSAITVRGSLGSVVQGMSAR